MARPSKPAPPRPDLDRLVRESVARFEALPPDKQAQLREAQRRSWVIGNMLLDHPEMTRERAAAIYDRLDLSRT